MVLDQFEAVRKTGLCNMFDQSCILQVCEAMGFEALAECITEHPHGEWLKLIVEGRKNREETNVSQNV
jgi:Domain of unknown function (DUF5049)